MSWEFPEDPRGLIKCVVPRDAGDLTGPEFTGGEAERVYSRLRAYRLAYAPPVVQGSSLTRIRSLDEVREGEVPATRLELALIYAGLAGRRGLRPFLMLPPPYSEAALERFENAVVVIPARPIDALPAWAVHGAAEIRPEIKARLALDIGAERFLALDPAGAGSGQGFAEACREGALRLTDGLFRPEFSGAAILDVEAAWRRSALAPVVRRPLPARRDDRPRPFDVRRDRRWMNPLLVQYHPDAQAAMPAFRAVGGLDPGLAELKRLYYRLMGSRWPEAETEFDLLCHAAMAQNLPGPLGGLERFVLGVAARNGAGLEEPVLLSWLRSRAVDLAAARAFSDELRVQELWAVITIGEDVLHHSPLPGHITVDLYPDSGDFDLGEPCAEERLIEPVLRKIVAELQHRAEGRKLVVDLVLPMSYLEKGIRIVDLAVVPDGNGGYTALSDSLEPRLRWSQHYRDHGVKNYYFSYRQRSGAGRWEADPVVLTEEDMKDEPTFRKRLLDAAEAPCLIAGKSRRFKQAVLRRILMEGFGYVVWDYGGQHEQAATDLLARWAAIPDRDLRRKRMPEEWSRPNGRGARPGARRAVIWADVDGRGDIRLPPRNPLTDPSGNEAQ
ncbi:hypothetical protein EDD29_3801 [Actinocorallia herbida]|uniref:Uncharacterized protein n=1 Tax=Actinocorallia herbida TaxID=58109 RepID=A0A3N1CZM4_9ACTN|nr:hypothetical protein [Actinocorallia herbida]ROO86238.1 hypothetical protein EDD29_3801 [Actinocorallia herbida]